jgi:hypothetical protein
MRMWGVHVKHRYALVWHVRMHTRVCLESLRIMYTWARICVHVPK